jgi:hypothetical protein
MNMKFALNFLFWLTVSICMSCTGCNKSGSVPGTKVIINNELYYTYLFDKKPGLGTVILKIEVYDKTNTKQTNLSIVAESGMPSMKGSHDSGPVQMQVNKFGNYLVPVNIVMPGDWLIKLKFYRDNKLICSGEIKFNV